MQFTLRRFRLPYPMRLLLLQPRPAPFARTLCRRGLHAIPKSDESRARACFLVLGAWLFALMLVGRTSAAEARAPAVDPGGLPFVRTYPLDEIGSVPRGLRLGFDHVGRVAVMYDGVFAVLNDSTWVHMIDPTLATRAEMTVVKVAHGQYYCGGRGSWGRVTVDDQGHFKATSLVSNDAPAWTQVTPFNRILETRTGVLFYELNGLVHWDVEQGVNHYFALPRLTSAFMVGERLFASCDDHQLHEINLSQDTVMAVVVPGLEGEIVSFGVPLDEAHTLLATRSGRMVVFDGKQCVPWGPQEEHHLLGRVTALERLVDGGVALAIFGRGVYLISDDGRLMTLLDLPDFQSVRTMAAAEPGVLWLTEDSAVHRVLYNSPLTSFGLHHGLRTDWPQIVRWRERTVVCSSGGLYELKSDALGQVPRFQPVIQGVAPQLWFAAGEGRHLMAGNAEGLFAVTDDGHLRSVLSIQNVAGLSFLEPDLCVVLGSREIAAVRYVDGQWRECSPRVPGVGDSPIRMRHYRTLWIEGGADHVTRLWMRDDKLVVEKLEMPWHGGLWTNVGKVGGKIVLSGATGARAFFDEEKGSWTQAPEWDAMLKQSPYWLLHLDEDETGVLWATHAQGVVTFTPREGGSYELDASTFELRNDSYPTVTLLPNSQIWISSGHSLYRVERQNLHASAPIFTKLVSLVANNRALMETSVGQLQRTPPRFSFDDNSLSFRFFSGTYAWRFPPSYEYQLGDGEPWTPMDPSLMLRFPKLRDGHYSLSVRQSGTQPSGEEPIEFSFVVDPPWYRHTFSYISYVVAALLATVALVLWMSTRARNRSAALENLVRERTKELKVTMDKLGDETRNAATLAERSRLAGEIHDSLQQGLSGTLLHLDATLTHPEVTSEVRAKLGVMRNMLSYAREEVQQAVWNLESPLLQDATLGEALVTLADFISPGAPGIKIVQRGNGVTLPPTVQHNLLRIAQEAITNAVKHAQAQQIEVTLEVTSELVRLAVVDDGRGFEPSTQGPGHGHLGLRGFQTRAKAIQAQLRIETAPGAGTKVEVLLAVSGEMLAPTARV